MLLRWQDADQPNELDIAPRQAPFIVGIVEGFYLFIFS